MNYQIHELPMDTEPATPPSLSTAVDGEDSILVNTALMARIEALESENMRLATRKSAKFCVDKIMHNDHLVSFYTGFKSFYIFLVFFQFLGPAVDRLNYWGKKATQRKRNRVAKIKSIDQLLVTLMKLRLNLKVVDLAFRFGVSASCVSRYITTWICFLYHQLKEIDWMPAVAQVSGTLPPAFRTQFQNTYALIDCSEIFVETPTDLQMQSSTWSSYKHHNTAKFLLACTPNGCFICFATLCWFHISLHDNPHKPGHFRVKYFTKRAKMAGEK